MHFEQVEIYSKQAKAVAAFYKKLGAQVSNQENNYTIQIGRSKLLVRPAQKSWTYHLAFNIPYDQIEDAKHWLSRFTDIQEFQGQSIVDFPKWGARAVYFYDPAGNILEFIARKPLGVKGNAEFSFQSVINISEVGWPVKHVAEAEEVMNLPVYSRFGPAFSALGDARALFIVVDAKVKKWIPNDDPIHFSPCRVHVVHEQQKLLFEREGGVETFQRTALK